MGWPLRIFAKRSDGATTGTFVHTLTALERLLNNLKGWNVYVHLNPTKGGGVKASDSQVIETRWFLADFDPVGEAPPGYDEVLVPDARCVAVDSGRGAQFWVPVTVHMPTPGWSHSAFAWARVHFHTNPYTKLDRTMEPSRVARMPGTINQRTGREASILYRPEVLQPYDALTIMEHLPKEALPAPSLVGPDIPLLDLLPYLPPRVIDTITQGASYPGRHDACFLTAACLAEVGLQLDRVLSLVHTANLFFKPEPLPRAEVERQVRNGYRKGKRENLNQS